MLRIAVCDDAVEICYEMERIILSVADKFSIPAVCEHYYTGEKLCRDLKSHEGFDLIFLDIELSDMSGIDIANSMILLKVALTDAKNIRNSSSSQSQNKIDTCGQNLRDCINGLVKIGSVDFKELDEAIAAAEAIDPEKYTDDSYTALYNALEEARILKDNTEAVQEDVNAAVESINNAISALVEKSDSSEESSETSSETSSESSSESSSETSSETGSESSSESSSEASSETGSESSGESDSEASSETGSEGSSESDSEASSQISNDSSEDEDKVANTGAASASGLSILIIAAAAGVIVTKKRSK